MLRECHKSRRKMNAGRKRGGERGGGREDDSDPNWPWSAGAEASQEADPQRPGPHPYHRKRKLSSLQIGTPSRPWFQKGFHQVLE